MEPRDITAIDIITHTPLWVWPLLAYTLFVGWRMTRDRIVAPWRLFIMPAIAAPLAMASLLSSGNTLAELAGFATGVASGVVAGLTVARRRPARLRDDGRLALSGDWLPLALMIGLFAVRYASGIAVGIDPRIADHPAFMFAGLFTSGLFAAVMIVRGLGALPPGYLRRAARSGVA